ncbi:MAG: O-antigen ligase family protein [Gammaproteobacteria bacterium]
MAESAMDWNSLRRRCDEASRWMAVATAFSLVVSTALCTVTMMLFLVFWIASGGYRAKLAQIRTHPIAISSLALLLMLTLGVLYSSATIAQALDTLRSYRELLYIPLLLTAFNEQQWQRRGYYTFLVAMGLTLILSYCKLFGWPPLGPPEQEYTVFKGRIAHGLLMAYAIYLWAEHFMQQGRWRWLWGILAALGLVNLLLMIGGRTGYFVFFALIVLFMYRHWRWRGVLASGMIVVGLALVAYYSSDIFRARMGEMMLDLKGPVPEAVTPGRLRLEFYSNTLGLIMRHPVLGGGTGSFIPEYAELAKEKDLYPTNNPHNEFLLITTQVGLLGLMLLLMLGYRQWRMSYGLRPEFSAAAQALIVTMAIGSLFNSLLLDFTEGHFYALLTGICYGRSKSK